MNRVFVHLHKILILPNPFKRAALELTSRLVQSLREYGFEPVLEEATAALIKSQLPGSREPELWNGVDLAMVLGGDGSMLNAARKVYPREIPLLGVNLGHLGFLTRVESHKIETALNDLQKGNYCLEERIMIEASVIRAQISLEKYIGLNDLVVAKSSFARMIRLETWIDGEYFTTYPADGLIVATATGSTAYSLSAGGPVLDPRLAAIMITPICAHSLYARPVILSNEARIRVVLDAAHTDIALTVDGQSGLTLKPGDEIYFSKAPQVTKLVRFTDQGLFEVLKSRFKEGRI
jgi:NAD+ kinase